ncbi:MAG TPA: DUF3078 domain-containing protein [Flavobacteriaceae bacterium]|nr:DUF3078 domain-containing protein [Flavobacteriaceae bacterium]HEX5742470.1 DUF3078 domain-containing protein [Flavobacteriaceae bacterium]
MKKHILLFTVLISCSFTIFSQEKIEISQIKEGWKRSGKVAITFNQSTFSNWVAGGENSLAANAFINYDFNYRKGDWRWDNKIITAYGMTRTKSNGTRKMDDRLEFNSVVGKKASKYWFYSAFFNFQSQFTNGYDYKTDPDAEMPVSKFLAPAYASFGPGLMYKKDDQFKFNLSPITSKIIIVADDYLSSIGAYGVSPNDKSRYELGFNASLYHKKDIMVNVSMENILNLYANYLEDFQNVDVNYQLNIVLQVNKYLSTNIQFHTIIDDNISKKPQFKEVLGVGANFLF